MTRIFKHGMPPTLRTADGSAYNGRYAWVVFSDRQIPRRGCSHPYLLPASPWVVDQLRLNDWSIWRARVCAVAAPAARRLRAGGCTCCGRSLVWAGAAKRPAAAHRWPYELCDTRGDGSRSDPRDAEAHGCNRPNCEYRI